MSHTFNQYESYSMTHQVRFLNREKRKKRRNSIYRIFILATKVCYRLTSYTVDQPVIGRLEVVVIFHRNQNGHQRKRSNGIRFKQCWVDIPVSQPAACKQVVHEHKDPVHFIYGVVRMPL